MANDGTDFIKELQEYGLTVSKKAANGHYKVYTPDGRWVMDFSHSSSDRNWRKAATRQLRRRLVTLYGGQVQSVQG